MKKWKCIVCGYIHEGEEPPEKCPVCGADKSKFIELPDEGEPKKAEPGEAESGEAESRETGAPVPKTEGKEDELSGMIVKYHAHPMTVHVPNGVLPVTVLFVLIALLFGCPTLETAAICNLAIVLLAMPAVLYTGYKNWRYKYKGARTDLFFTKIICGVLVTGLSAFLLMWWIIDPDAASSGGGAGWIFLLFHLVTLLFAVIAGLMGGRLVFRE